MLRSKGALHAPTLGLQILPGRLFREKFPPCSGRSLEQRFVIPAEVLQRFTIIIAVGRGKAACKLREIGDDVEEGTCLPPPETVSSLPKFIRTHGLMGGEETTSNVVDPCEIAPQALYDSRQNRDDACSQVNPRFRSKPEGGIFGGPGVFIYT